MAIAAAEDDVIVTENTVAFLSISSEDEDTLLKTHPDWEEGIIEGLSDFYSYAPKVAETLKRNRIAIKFGDIRKVVFLLPDGKKEKLSVRPEDIWGIAMLAKGKSPKFLATLDPTPDALKRTVSEYFGIELKNP